MAEIKNINNIEDIENEKIDVQVALSIVCEFWDVSSCAIVKNDIPVGVALAPTVYEAKIKALDCNPVDAIGATIAFSKKVDKDTAKSLVRMAFPRVIVPKLDKEVMDYLKNFEIEIFEIEFSLESYKKMLLEKSDEDLTPKTFKVATKLKPTQEQIEDMVFAWKVLKTIKKDAIIIAKDFKTRAIELGKGLKHIEIALDNACDGSKEAILALSKNISDVKELHPAIQGRIIGIIEPKNGENTDKEVLKMAEKYGITVVVTGKPEDDGQE